uniref:C2H2-type domain-containing protein n=3 Tax=Clastoptera arizonana TaxID=38151 RepID=A0A1B6E4F8_9HEMI
METPIKIEIGTVEIKKEFCYPVINKEEIFVDNEEGDMFNNIYNLKNEVENDENLCSTSILNCEQIFIQENNFMNEDCQAVSNTENEIDSCWNSCSIEQDPLAISSECEIKERKEVQNTEISCTKNIIRSNIDKTSQATRISAPELNSVLVSQVVRFSKTLISTPSEIKDDKPTLKISLKPEVLNEDDDSLDSENNLVIEFMSEDESNGEFTSNNNDNTLFCAKCKTEWPSTEQYQFHVKICSGTNENIPTFCFKCKTEWATTEQFETHIKICSGLKKGESFACDMCQSEFTTSRECQIHEANCQETLFRCSECNYSTKTPTVFSNHMRTHGINDSFACKSCNYKTKSYSCLKRHVLKHEEQYKCNTCSYSTKSQDELKNHLKQKCTLPYNCTVCDFASSKFHLLTDHMTEHDNQVPCVRYSCNLCSYNTLKMRNFKKHQKTHDIEKPYKCDVCEFGTFREKALKIHKLVHERIYACNICEFRTSSPSNLRTHKHDHHGNKPFKCTDCDFETNTSFRLGVHMRQHTGERSFKCHLCNATFAVKHSLKYHLCSHGENPFKCRSCDFAAKTPKELRSHKLSEHQKKLYTCEYCDHVSIRSYNLIIHRRIHTGEKPYSCDQCNYRFSSVNQLKSHVLIHMENPKENDKFINKNQCNFCSEAFLTNKERIKHIKEQHTNGRKKPNFGCTICDSSFNRFIDYRKHMVDHGIVKHFQCTQCDLAFASKTYLKFHASKIHANTATNLI